MKRKRGGSRRQANSEPKHWPAANVEMRRISELKPRATNPNTHSLEQIEQLCDLMEEFGWTIPILIDEKDEILAGEGRWRAGRIKGYAEAPTIVARGWSDAQKAAYVMADNQVARNSKWDPKMLKSEVRGLVAAEFDVGLLAFDSSDLERLMIDPAQTSSEPTEVTMQRCPTCGGLRRKSEKKS
jgi:ParB-like chromosome segregation protein Spo0J